MISSSSDGDQPAFLIPVTFRSVLRAHISTVGPQDLPLIEAHYPATFRERGVAAPFTTPLLAGSRLRESSRGGIELLVPSPSGGRGVYVLHWSAVRERYRPTVHDSVLLQRLAGPTSLHPRTVRAVSWDVAREGLAGREARTAAETAANSDRSQLLLAVFVLLNALVEQVEPDSLKLISVADRSAALDDRVSGVLNRLGPSFGRSGRQLRDTLAALGTLFAPLGVTPDDRESHVARLIEQLQDTRDHMVGSFLVSEENDGIRLGRSVTASMDTTLTCARGLLSATHALLSNPLSLLKHWVVAPEQVSALVTRTEWVLDGWERICLLWQSAQTNVTRRSALLEMVQLIPVLPREVMEWTRAKLPAETLDPTYRVTCQNDSWRSGGVAFTQIGRNEHLRGMSL